MVPKANFLFETRDFRTRLAFASAIAWLLWARPVGAFEDGDVSRGRQLFSERCVPCHAVDGLPPPPRYIFELSGPNARLRLYYLSHAPGRDGSAAALLDYIMVKMPLTRPGSLTEGEGLALTTFLLRANGVEPNGEVATRDELAKVVLEDAFGLRWRTAKRVGIVSSIALVLTAIVMQYRRRRRLASPS